MKIIIGTAALATVLVAATAPAAAQNREHLQMAAELRMLQEQQVQLSLKIDQLTQALTDAVKAINGRVDQTNGAITKGFADQALGIKQMAQDLTAIRANTQDTSTRLGQLREEIEALRTSLPSLLTRLIPPPAPVTTDPLDPNAPAQPPPPVATDFPPAPVPSTAGLSPDRLFSTAEADYAGGQFTLAISGFEQFLRAFPTSERADDAQQFIGDAEYAQMRFEEAIAAYNRVIQNYPKGDQVPWAYYKRALTQMRMGRTEEARSSLESAIKSAPGTASEVAVLAKQRLDGLTRAPAATPQRP
jgi:TolA-binding protein